MVENADQIQTNNFIPPDQTATYDLNAHTIDPNQPSKFNIKIKWLVILAIMFLLGILSTIIILYLISLKTENSNKKVVTQLSEENLTSIPTLIPQITEYPPVTISPTPTTKSPLPTITRSGAHFYNNPAKPIDNIFVTIVYFVPKGVQPDNNWQEGLNRNLLAIKNFYERELSNKAKINYKVHPEYISANNDYNLAIPNTSPDYEQGCTSALNSAMSEIKLKVKNNSSDLSLWAVVFESLNCAIASDANLLVPGYIIDQAFEPVSSEMPSVTGKLLGHEFGHLLGIPDSYNTPEDYIHNNVTEPFCDVLSHCQGDGKARSLDQSFLCDKNKRALGII